MVKKELQSKRIQDLFDIILLFKSKIDLEDFLIDLLTPQELEEFASRWASVVEVSKGKTHRAIAQELSISVSTTSRASKVLKYGRGGFGKALKMITQKNN